MIDRTLKRRIERTKKDDLINLKKYFEEIIEFINQEIKKRKD